MFSVFPTICFGFQVRSECDIFRLLSSLESTRSHTYPGGGDVAWGWREKRTACSGLGAPPCLWAIFRSLGHLDHLEGMWAVLEFLPHTQHQELSCWLGVGSREGAGSGTRLSVSDHRTTTRPGDRATHVCPRVYLQNKEKKEPTF